MVDSIGKRIQDYVKGSIGIGPFAKKLGYKSRAAIYTNVFDAENIPPITMKRICKILGVPVNYFIHPILTTTDIITLLKENNRLLTDENNRLRADIKRLEESLKTSK